MSAVAGGLAVRLQNSRPISPPRRRRRRSSRWWEATRVPLTNGRPADRDGPRPEPPRRPAGVDPTRGSPAGRGRQRPGGARCRPPAVSGPTPACARPTGSCWWRAIPRLSPSRACPFPVTSCSPAPCRPRHRSSTGTISAAVAGCIASGSTRTPGRRVFDPWSPAWPASRWHSCSPAVGRGRWPTWACSTLSRQQGVTVDRVAGTSMGAYIASLYATGAKCRRRRRSRASKSSCGATRSATIGRRSPVWPVASVARPCCDAVSATLVWRSWNGSSWWSRPTSMSASPCTTTGDSPSRWSPPPCRCPCSLRPDVSTGGCWSTAL